MPLRRRIASTRRSRGISLCPVIESAAPRFRSSSRLRDSSEVRGFPVPCVREFARTALLATLLVDRARRDFLRLVLGLTALALALLDVLVLALSLAVHAFGIRVPLPRHTLTSTAASSLGCRGTPIQSDCQTCNGAQQKARNTLRSGRKEHRARWESIH